MHLFHHEGGYKFQQVVHEGGIAILGDIKNSTRKDHEQPDLLEPAPSTESRWVSFRAPFQPKLFLGSVAGLRGMLVRQKLRSQ